VAIKDLQQSGDQETVEMAAVIEEVRKRLG
jgi:hypothetical protein